MAHDTEKQSWRKKEGLKNVWSLYTIRLSRCHIADVVARPDLLSFAVQVPSSTEPMAKRSKANIDQQLETKIIMPTSTTRSGITDICRPLRLRARSLSNQSEAWEISPNLAALPLK